MKLRRPFLFEVARSHVNRWKQIWCLVNALDIQKCKIFKRTQKKEKFTFLRSFPRGTCRYRTSRDASRKKKTSQNMTTYEYFIKDLYLRSARDLQYFAVFRVHIRSIETKIHDFHLGVFFNFVENPNFSVQPPPKSFLLRARHQRPVLYFNL